MVLCQSAKQRRADSLRLPYECRSIAAPGMRRARWFLALTDGNAWAVLDKLKAHYNRFTHMASPAPIHDYLPRGAPILFSSPSVIAMYMSDFLLADGSLDVRKRNNRAPVSALADGQGDLSGPACLLRALMSSASESVLAAVWEALRPTAGNTDDDASGAVLVGVHLRRGDAAMQSECADCINGEDPDVVDKHVRISLPDMSAKLRCVNKSMEAIVEATGRRTFAFVASDTVEALAMARKELGASRVLTTEGAAVHSTRPRAAGERTEAVKVAADFLGLAISDVHFGLGDSSFLGNAAAAGMAPIARVGDRVPSGNVCRQITQQELEALRQELRPPREAEPTEATASRHVEL
jgi:hypothetical protein